MLDTSIRTGEVYVMGVKRSDNITFDWNYSNCGRISGLANPSHQSNHSRNVGIFDSVQANRLKSMGFVYGVALGTAMVFTVVRRIVTKAPLTPTANARRTSKQVSTLISWIEESTNHAQIRYN